MSDCLSDFGTFEGWNRDIWYISGIMMDLESGYTYQKQEIFYSNTLRYGYLNTNKVYHKKNTMTHDFWLIKIFASTDFAL